MDDTNKVNFKEEVVCSKFEGDPLPENEIERITLVDGKIVKHEFLEDGKVISTKEVE